MAGDGFRVAIVGATGLVGEEMRNILDQRDFPVASLRLLASKRSEGRQIPWRGSEITVEALDANNFDGVDIALFSAGSDVSREYAPMARDAGAVVIDNSSAWRMDPDVPLIVPEVNPGALEKHRGIIANPNCSTIQIVVALKPLHDLWTAERVVISTYQAVSGTGKEAVNELIDQAKAALEGRILRPKVYRHPIAFNIFPRIDVFLDSGYTKEEVKMIEETRKIMDLPDLRVTATAARVPVVVSHSVSLNVEFLNGPVDIARARQVFERSPGVTVLDEPERDVYPTPLAAVGTDMCYVGRLRRDVSVENGVDFWVVADNLRKGAALNAVQIAEVLAAGNR